MTPQMFASMLQGAASALQPVVAAALGSARTSPAQTQAVQTGMQALQQAAGAVAGAETTSAALPAVQRGVVDAQALLGVLATLPLPPQVSMGLMAANVVVGMLPGLMAMVHPAG